MVDVVEAREVTPSLVAAFERLIPQLSSSNPPPSEEALRAIVDSSTCHLLVATAGEEIVGSLTLVVFPIPTGTRAWIEDVVVDRSARGRGIGRRLTEHALDLARRLGAKTVDLTSRPSREAANRLYQDVGFQRRETNVYRYQL
ncbi:MAG TPA: GNAT family N-acetyltransferase [Acidimicrobiia bacterium]|nr:GNAT family N-acetyltransferase [Acidimicrobiia bacterium]